MDVSADPGAYFVKVLPGRSAYGWNRTCRAISWVAVGFGFLLAAGATVDSILGGVYRLLLLVPLIGFESLSAVFLTVLLIVLPRKEHREVHAGYTSLQGRHAEVPQVIPGTDLVIRPAGQPYLSQSEFQVHLRHLSARRQP